MKTTLAETKQFIVDASGKPVGVLLDLSTYELLREAAEDNADLTAYRAAKTRVAGEIALASLPPLLITATAGRENGNELSGHRSEVCAEGFGSAAR